MAVKKSQPLTKEQISEKLKLVFPDDGIEDKAAVKELRDKIAEVSELVNAYFVDAMGIQYMDKNMQVLFDYSISRQGTDELVHTFDFYQDNQVYNYIEKVSFSD